MKSISTAGWLAAMVLVSTAGLSSAFAKGSDCSTAFAPTVVSNIQTAALAANDKLAKVVLDVRTQWGDDNISSGTSSADSAVLSAIPKSGAETNALAKALFIKSVKESTDSDVPATVKLNVQSGPLTDAVVAKTVEALMTSNDYADENTESKTALKRQTKRMLKSLGAPASIRAFTVSAKLDNDSSGDKRAVELDGFFNVETNKLVLIFTIEGSM